jgi:hypothetical protein
MATDKGRQSKIMLGLNVQGDIGPMTFYTNKNHKLVGFLRAPPLNPPTQTQEFMRDFYRDCATAWRALGAAERAKWNRVSRKCNLSISGYNLWCWFTRGRDESALRTLENQAGESLTRP